MNSSPVFGAQERDDLTEVAGVADGAARDAALPRRRCRRRAAMSRRGGVQTREDRVHGDAVLRDFPGERAQEAGRAGACGVRQDEPADRLAHRDRGDRDDATPVLLLHRGHRGVAHGHDGQQVQLDGVCVGVEGRRGEVAGRRSSAVRHEDVEPAERLLRGLDERGRAGGRRDIRDEGDRVRTDLGRGLVDAGLVSAADRDRERLRRRAPRPTRSRDPSTQPRPRPACRSSRGPSEPPPLPRKVADNLRCK